LFTRTDIKSKLKNNINIGVDTMKVKKKDVKKGKKKPVKKGC